MEKFEIIDHVRCSVSASRLLREPTFLVWARDWLDTNGANTAKWYPPTKAREQWESLPADQLLGLGAAVAAVRAAKALAAGLHDTALIYSLQSRDWLAYAASAQAKTQELGYWDTRRRSW